METTTPDWTSLPEHLLASIAKHLQAHIDILRFRAVCRSFRHALPRSRKLLFPHSVLRTTHFLRGPNPRDENLFFLIESTVYAIQPLNRISNAHNQTSQSQTWLVKVEESTTGKVRIKDPLSGYCFRNLSKKLPSSLNLLDYRVKEISKSYALESAAILKGKGKGKIFHDSRKPSVISKVIVSPFLDESADGFALMARYGSGRELGVWRNVDKTWTDIDTGLDYLEDIADIIYHNNKFYVLVSTGLSLTVDYKSLTVTEVAAEPKDNLKFSLLYLVESFKDLFLIAEFESNEDYCKVFKLDEQKHKWVRVVDGTELEDRVFFVGRDVSYSVSAKEFSGCKGNCVYFNYYSNKYNHPAEDARIFDLCDGRVGKLSDFPGYSNVFWPPPTWLKQH